MPALGLWVRLAHPRWVIWRLGPYCLTSGEAVQLSSGRLRKLFGDNLLGALQRTGIFAALRGLPGSDAYQVTSGCRIAP